MSLDLNSIIANIPLVSGGTVAAGTIVVPILKVPGTADGGGINVRRWWFGSNAVIASGSAPAVKLVTLNSASLPIGTIGSNGSAALAAGTALSGTLSTNWVAGTVTYLGVQVGQGAYGAATTVFLNVGVDYYYGRGSS